MTATCQAWCEGAEGFSRDAFHAALQAIMDEPEVVRLARARARDRDLADDARQQAFCDVAGVAYPERIADLRAYYCRVLLRAIRELRGQLRALPVADPAGLAGRGAGPSGPVLFDDIAAARIDARARLARFQARRQALLAAVPPRSDDPVRYRQVIADGAERVLRDATAGWTVSPADSNASLCAAYPQWFGSPGCADNTCHQHLSRARADIRNLLKAVVSAGELRS